nr:probable 2,3-bisphosphoglycerate-independent phosphoglycerate mutase isoform X2 [Tanacetum cinerariifolium]
MEEVVGRGGRRKKVTGHGAHRKKVAGRRGRRKKVTGKGGRHEEGVWSVKPDLFRSGGHRLQAIDDASHDKATVFKVKALEVVDKTIRQLARLLGSGSEGEADEGKDGEVEEEGEEEADEGKDGEESYIGDPIAKWDVGLCEESKEQVSLLRHM